MALDAHLDLNVRRNWSTAEHVRTGVGAVVEAVFADSDLGYMLSMVAAELVENALKYGGPEEDRVHVLLQGGSEDITLEVTARGEPSPADLWRLRERIAWLEKFEDAAEAYRAALLAAATGEPDSRGLGLARVRYEGGCDLDVRTDAGGITVVARYDLTDGLRRLA